MRAQRIWTFLYGGSLTRVVLWMVGVVGLGAVVVGLMERPANDQFRSLWDAAWWALVTITTVGYGDKVPVTAGARILTGILVFVGIALTSVLTAVIASTLTARRIKQERGLEEIPWKGHIVLCGWNRHGEEVVEVLLREEPKVKIALVNQLPEESAGEVMARFRGASIRYVRGDFVQEDVLRRAGVGQARAVLVLADEVGARPSDERALLAVLAAKSIGREVRVCTELRDPENLPHVRRAGADDVVLYGEYSAFLLASSVTSPGVPQAVRTLLGRREGPSLRQVEFPDSFVGKTFGELARYLRKEGMLLIGLVREERGMGLQDLLTDDYSAVDRFIKEQFRKAGLGLLPEGSRVHVVLNPKDDRRIEEGDRALVIV